MKKKNQKIKILFRFTSLLLLFYFLFSPFFLIFAQTKEKREIEYIFESGKPLRFIDLFSEANVNVNALLSDLEKFKELSQKCDCKKTKSYCFTNPGWNDFFFDITDEIADFINDWIRQRANDLVSYFNSEIDSVVQKYRNLAESQLRSPFESKIQELRNEILSLQDEINKGEDPDLINQKIDFINNEISQIDQEIDLKKNELENLFKGTINEKESEFKEKLNNFQDNLENEITGKLNTSQTIDTSQEVNKVVNPRVEKVNEKTSEIQEKVNEKTNKEFKINEVWRVNIIDQPVEEKKAEVLEKIYITNNNLSYLEQKLYEKSDELERSFEEEAITKKASFREISFPFLDETKTLGTHWGENGLFGFCDSRAPVIGDPCKDVRSELDALKLKIKKEIYSLEKVKKILEEELSDDLAFEVRKFYTEKEGKEFKDNILAFRDALSNLLSKSKKIISSLESCSSKNCVGNCKVEANLDVEACLGKVPASNENYLVLNLGVSLPDVNLGKVFLEGFDLALPNKIKFPFGKISDIDISLNDIVLNFSPLRVSGGSQILKATSRYDINLPFARPPSFAFNCPQYPVNPKQVVKYNPRENFYEIPWRWHFQNFEWMSQKCQNIIGLSTTTVGTTKTINIKKYKKDNKLFRNLEDAEKNLEKCFELNPDLKACNKWKGLKASNDKNKLDELEKYFNLCHQEVTTTKICLKEWNNFEKAKLAYNQSLSQRLANCLDIKNVHHYILQECSILWNEAIPTFKDYRRYGVFGALIPDTSGWYDFATFLSACQDVGGPFFQKALLAKRECEKAFASDPVKEKICNFNVYYFKDVLSGSTAEKRLLEQGYRILSAKDLLMLWAVGMTNPREMRKFLPLAVLKTGFFDEGVVFRYEGQELGLKKDYVDGTYNLYLKKEEIDKIIDKLSQKCDDLKKEAQKKENPTDIPEFCNYLPLLTNKFPEPSEEEFYGEGGTIESRTVYNFPYYFESALALACAPPPQPLAMTFPKIIIPDIYLPHFALWPLFEIKLPNIIFEDLILPDLNLCDLKACGNFLGDFSFVPTFLDLGNVGLNLPLPGFDLNLNGRLLQVVPNLDFNFNLPSLYLPTVFPNFFDVLLPKFGLPQVNLPIPQITLGIQELHLDLAGLLMGLLAKYIPWGGCVKFGTKFLPIRIIFPDIYISFGKFPEVPEIAFCKDINEFCQKVKEATWQKLMGYKNNTQDYINNEIIRGRGQVWVDQAREVIRKAYKRKKQGKSSY